MLRWLGAVAISALSAFATVTPGQAAEKRVALFIRNTSYSSVPRLANAQNDARAIAQTLSR